MKRRRVLQSLAATPLAAAAPAPAPAQQAAAAARNLDEYPKLTLSMPDSVGAPRPRFFSPEQFSALKRLAEVIMPAARDAEAAEFLDFLLSESPADRQALYRTGLDRLNGAARKASGKPFAETPDPDALLAPLRQPATPGSFLHAAKDDILTATFNSREWAAKNTGGRRGAAGLNTYWVAVE